MLIVYDSKTGNVKRFVKELKLEAVQVEEGLLIDQDFILITYTTKIGEIPQKTNDFLVSNSKYLKAVAVSGNIIWGDRFGRAGDIISKQYNVPLLLKFEMSGMKSDIEKLKGEVERI